MKLSRGLEGKKAVFLDLDNTLYAYDPCHAKALKTTYRYYAHRVEKISFLKFYDRYCAARKIVHDRFKGTAFSHSRFHYFKVMTKKVSLAKNLEEVYWKDFLKHMKLRDWVIPFLNKCRKKQIKVVIVTNLTTAIQKRKIRKFKIGKFIDGMITSEQAGAEKPSPKIFKLALARVRCRPRDVLLVGDDAKADSFGRVDFVRI